MNNADRPSNIAPRDVHERIVTALRSRLDAAGADTQAWSDALLEAAAALGFTGVGVWLLQSDGKLRCKLFAARSPMELFEEQTKARSFAAREGMPGRTWVQLTPEWIPNVIKDDNFPRLRGAIRDLVRAVVAFPVRRGDQPVAVIEMYSRYVLQPDAETTAVLERLGEFLGEYETQLMKLATAG